MNNNRFEIQENSRYEIRTGKYGSYFYDKDYLPFQHEERTRKIQKK